jgi:hypothetical protein
VARILYVAKLAVDKDSGLPLPSLAGQSVTIVRRGTTTPVSITEDEAGTLVVPGSVRVVTDRLFIGAFWVDEADMPVSALGGGIEVPLETAEGIAKRLNTLEPALVAASDAAVETAASVAGLQKWVDLGITRRNLITNPSFETSATGWTGANCAVSWATSPRASKVGARVGTITVSAPAGTVSASANPVPVAPGQWVAASILLGRSTGATYARIALEWRSGETVLSQTAGAYGVLSGGDLARQSVGGEAPATATSCRLVVYPVAGSSGGTPPDGVTVVDGAILVVGDTQSLSLAAVSPYFDGDTLPSASRVSHWESAAHASVSAQLDMAQITDQRLPAGGTMGQALVKASGADRDVTWGTVSGGSGGTSVHGLLGGLDQDDHPQYLNVTRGDGRYYTKGQVDTAVNNAASAQSAADRNRANHTGTQPIASIIGLQDVIDGLGGTAVNSVAGKTGHVVLVSSDISDTGATGREVMGATTAAAARTAIGAAASSHTHSPSQTGATAVGQGLMSATDAAGARGVIGAGTSSVELGTTSTTAMRGNAIVLNPSSIAGLPVGTFVART